MSCLKCPPKVVIQKSFYQFVFDNADVNIDTMMDTFHTMEGIQCITSFTSISFEKNIKKKLFLPLKPLKKTIKFKCMLFNE